jgi:hypothetical protein
MTIYPNYLTITQSKINVPKQNKTKGNRSQLFGYLIITQSKVNVPKITVTG